MVEGTGLENLRNGFCQITSSQMRPENKGFFMTVIGQILWINPKVGTEWALKLGLQCGIMALKLRKFGKESLQRAC